MVKIATCEGYNYPSGHQGYRTMAAVFKLTPEGLRRCVRQSFGSSWRGEAH